MRSGTDGGDASWPLRRPGTGRSGSLLLEFRGRGIGRRAQAKLCDYLFRHTPVQRIQAGAHPESVAEQRPLEKAGFRLEGVLRACEFRDGAWRDGHLFSRLRTGPAPDPGAADPGAATPGSSPRR